MQRIDHPDPAQANTQALHDLENGADGLTLVFAGAVGARGFGLPPSAEACCTPRTATWKRSWWVRQPREPWTWKRR